MDKAGCIETKYKGSQIFTKFGKCIDKNPLKILFNHSLTQYENCVFYIQTYLLGVLFGGWDVQLGWWCSIDMITHKNAHFHPMPLFLLMNEYYPYITVILHEWLNFTTLYISKLDNTGSLWGESTSDFQGYFTMVQWCEKGLHVMISSWTQTISFTCNYWKQ